MQLLVASAVALAACLVSANNALPSCASNPGGLLPPGRFTVWSNQYLSAGFPYRDTICTNAGGYMCYNPGSFAAPGTLIKSNLVIPSDCLPNPGTTYDQCLQIASLWANKINYCCPLWPDYPGGSYGFAPQLKANDPRALSAFPAAELNALGIPLNGMVKWVGNPDQPTRGGCRIAWDCIGRNKANCKASGPLCVWEGTAGCVEQQGYMKTLYCALNGC